MPEERTGELAARLDATRTVRRLAAEPGDYKAIAAAARDRHRPGTLTLVVLNTVDGRPGGVQGSCGAGRRECTLLHSRFRGVERSRTHGQRITGRPAETGIVVATQVVEAGIDLNAAVLVTEAAPWPSLVQRAGRCNRTGRVDGAELWWVAAGARPRPYEQADIDAAVAELDELEGQRGHRRGTAGPRRRGHRGARLRCCAGAISSGCSTRRRT